MSQLIAADHQSVAAQALLWLDLADTGQPALERDPQDADVRMAVQTTHLASWRSGIDIS